MKRNVSSYLWLQNLIAAISLGVMTVWTALYITDECLQHRIKKFELLNESEKSKGPEMVPWGTPHVMLAEENEERLRHKQTEIIS